MIRRVLLVSAVGALCALSPRTVRADGGDATALFDQAVKLLLPPKDPRTGKVPIPTRADIDQACNLAQQSVDLGATLGSVNLLAICRSQQERHASALAAYQRVVLMSPKSKDEAQKIARAQENITKLQAVVSTVRVVITARVDGLSVTINGVSFGPGQWDTPVPFDGGTWQVRAGAPGHETYEGTVTIGVMSDRAEVVIPALTSNEPVAAKIVETQPPPPPPPHADDDAVESAPIPVEPPPRGMSTQRKAAIGVGAAGVVALGTALVFEMKARSAYDDYLATPTPDQTLLDAADNKRYTAIGLGVVGGVCVGAAAVLWVRGANHAEADDDDVSIVPSFVGNGQGITVRGRF